MSGIWKFFQYPTTTSKELEKLNTTIVTNKDQENKYQFVQYPRPDPKALLKGFHPDKGGRRRKTTQRRRRRKTQTQKRKQGKSKRRRRM